MNPQTFAQLSDIRRGMLDGGLRAAAPDRPGLAGLFVPWAGAQLAAGAAGCVYHVGMATDGDYGAASEQSFGACLGRTEGLCAHGHPHGRGHAPFWRFLDGLARALLGGPCHGTADRWGWSNLLKIGWHPGSPSTWPKAARESVIGPQRAACAAALHGELGRLRGSLVVLGSSNGFGVRCGALAAVLGRAPEWEKEGHEETGVWWLRDPASDNLYVWCHHPNAAQRMGFFGAQLERTVWLARRHLPAFAA